MYNTVTFLMVQFITEYPVIEQIFYILGQA